GDYSVGAFSDAPFSAPRSLLARTGLPSGGKYSVGVVTKRWPSPASEAAFDADVRIESADPNGSGTAFSLVFGALGAMASVRAPNNGTMQLVVDTQNDTKTFTLPPPQVIAVGMHEWFHLHFEITTGSPATSPATVTLVVTRAGAAPITL